MLDEKQGRSEGFKFSDMFSLQLQDQYATLRLYYSFMGEVGLREQVWWREDTACPDISLV